ncbi:MAG TPA: 4-alpha-glucanotransferase [Candidatus Limnocylindria bacterium]|nr:4-alpha-glucanotransferase [Candidatus Limnocylindria bacterium]
MTDAWGVADGYEDALGTWHTAPEATRAELRAAMGADDAGGPAASPVRVLRPGDDVSIAAPARLTLEDGTTLDVAGALPRELPFGYHDLQPLDGGEPIRLIVSPGRCPLPDGLREWGWAAQVYAMRSSQSWGFGDLADLRRLGAWSARLGAGLVLINPLHAPLPRADQQASPYCPSSRRFLNPLYLRIEEVPGAAMLGDELAPLAAAGRALNALRIIDRPAVFRLKLDALERVWRRGHDRAGLDAFRRERGHALEEFAIFCAIAERHEGGWPDWPAEYRRPESPAVTRFAAAHADRVRFHEWLQWLLDRQLGEAARQVRLMQDLPVGVDPGGADAWAWQDVLVTGATVGAPPDRYNRHGQDWGLPPMAPHRLRAARYEPFVQTIRASLRHAGGLRIDHVMGLFRLFWIPRGRSPVQGGYVRYPADDLLAIVALETHRAGAVVVGEDLGTVEEGVREKLAAHRILSYRVVWFESDPPARYPALAMAAVTTHDLPTIAGLWTGTDLAEQEALGLEPNADAFARLRDELGRVAGAATDDAVDSVVELAHRALARAPSVLVTATLDDALAVAERPNMPGSVAERPNWSLALPAPLEELESAPLALSIAASLYRNTPRLEKRVS